MSKLKWIIAAVVLIFAAWYGVPHFLHSLGTVSTNDAYVNGHVTFVAPRVSGQVARVLVDDNDHVHKGDLLAQLDKEPYQVQVNIAESAVASAQTALVSTQAQTRGLAGKVRGLRYNLEHSMEEVNNQVALLQSRVATLALKQATMAKTQADVDRAEPLMKSGAVSQQQFDVYKEALSVAQGQVEEAQQGIYQVRASLGLPPKPADSDDLANVPADLEQNFSTVRQALGNLQEGASQLGIVQSLNISPKETIANFYARDPEGNIERIYDEILKNAPSVKQAEAKLAEAERNLDQAKLNLRYCDVISEIDGVVTRREVNPGNNVIAGESIMTIRSVTEIWVDANFKETQLGNLKIGLPVDLNIDMYGKKQQFRGRISGFTMGTGSTLALLPAENATGNFVKVVQRLPVRIELMDYDPDKTPLFIGLSVTPTVNINEAPTGPDAGKVLRPYSPNTETKKQP